MTAITKRVREFAVALLAAAGMCAVLSPAQAQYPALIEASEIANGDGSLGFIMQGETESADLIGLVVGSGVSAVGDVNADGRDDFAISSIGADVNGSNSGQLFVVFGRDTAFPNPFDLTALDGSEGFVINGEANGDFFGSPVSAAGDINGDGIDDLAACGSREGPNGILSGRCYVVYGSAAGFPAVLELSTLDGSNGFAINGENAGDRAGTALRSAGDVNADGLADLLIGAFGADPNGVDSGRAYIVYGNAAGFVSPLELSSLNGTNGVIINGPSAGERAGIGVAGVNDINNDGIDDVAITANLISTAFRSYVVYGEATGLASPFELSTLDGSNGFAIEEPTGNLRFSIQSAGDFNADGVADLALVTSGADFNGIDSGRVTVVFGPSSAFPAVLDLTMLDASNAFVIDGENPDDRLGNGAVTTVGDINGDGIDDLAIGANEASPNGPESGRAYVIFGSASASPGVFDLSTLNGSNGFAMNGEFADDEFGGSISGLGDVNGDGLEDLILSAPEADPNGIENGGRSYVLYGRSGLSPQPPGAHAVPTLDLLGLLLLCGLLMTLAWFSLLHRPGMG